MPKQTHLGIRMFALANALLLTFGLVANRAGYLPTENLVALIWPNKSLNQISTKAKINHPVPKIEQEELLLLGRSGSIEMDPAKTQANHKLPNDEGSGTQAPLINLAANRLRVPEPEPEPMIIAEAKRHVLELAEAKLAQLEYDYLNSNRRAMIVSTKEIVLVEPKLAKLKAKGAFKSFENRTRESFDSRDRNHDGKLTRDELDDRVWARCLEHQVVNNDAVSFEGFAVLFEWYSIQTSFESPKVSKTDIAN